MRAEKELLLNEVRETIEHEHGFLIARHKGLTAGMAHQLRSDLWKVGAEFEVVRKRLLYRAAEDAKVDLGPVQTEGHLGVVIASSDPVSTTKAVVDFGKAHEGAFELLSGRFDGVLYTVGDLMKLATLPDIDTLRAQVIGLFAAPMSQLLGGMQALLAAIPYCLHQRAEQNK